MNAFQMPHAGVNLSMSGDAAISSLSHQQQAISPHHSSTEEKKERFCFITFPPLLLPSAPALIFCNRFCCKASQELLFARASLEMLPTFQLRQSLGR